MGEKMVESGNENRVKRDEMGGALWTLYIVELAINTKVTFHKFQF